jgi:hypothetical protein
MLTTGLKCAPEILEKELIITNKIALVAIVLAKRAIASFPFDSFSAHYT